MKVCCVSVPPKYQDDDWVGKLYRGLIRNTKHAFSFEVIKQSEYRGWWAKMDLLPTTGRCVYIDLDVVITGNVDFLFEYEGDFCIKRDPWSKWDAGLMAFSPGWGKSLKDTFLANPGGIMKSYRSDQEFIRKMVATADEWPSDKVKSYKADNLAEGPGGASIVMFHGEPKPNQIKTGWVKELWS